MTAPRLDPQAVRALADLARIAVEPADLPALARQLQGIVDYVGQIEGATLAPRDLPPDAPAHLRKDAVLQPSGFDVADRLLAGAPARDADLIVVPRVLE